MDIKKEFEETVNKIKTSSGANIEITDTDKLHMYKYQKQATVGNCDIPRPWAIQFQECAKWDAWNSVKDMSKEEAMSKYIELYEILYKTYSV